MKILAKLFIESDYKRRPILEPVPSMAPFTQKHLNLTQTEFAFKEIGAFCERILSLLMNHFLW